MSDDEDEDYDYKNILACNVVLLGERNVGKTSIINRYVNNEFIYDTQTTKGGVFHTKSLLMKNEKLLIKFEIWDTSGQYGNRSLSKIFIKNAAVIIFVYDITDSSSFLELKNFWIKEVKENAHSDVSK